MGSQDVDLKDSFRTGVAAVWCGSWVLLSFAKALTIARPAESGARLNTCRPGQFQAGIRMPSDRTLWGVFRDPCCAPATERPRFRKRGEILRFQSLNLEAAFHDERRHVPSEMQAFEQPMCRRLPPSLPAAHHRVTRQS